MHSCRAVCFTCDPGTFLFDLSKDSTEMKRFFFFQVQDKKQMKTDKLEEFASKREAVGDNNTKGSRISFNFKHKTTFD